MTDHPIQDQARRAGILYPQQLPEFHRLAPSSDVAHAVSWFWIPEWHLPVGETSLQRVAARYFGLSLHAMIRRRRLQEAADRLRSDPDLTIAHLAGELGYADHAHFTSDFRRLLGVTPSDYRASAAATPSSESR